MPVTPHVVLATPAPISHRTAEENLGLAYLAATLRKHDYRVTIIDGWLQGLSSVEIAQAIHNQEKPLWVGFSCYRTNMERVVETVRCLKAMGSDGPFVVGGFGPTFHPDDFLKEGIDVVVRGEGEQTVLELCRYFEVGAPNLGAIQGISFLGNGAAVHNSPRPLLVDIDSLPFPERDTLNLAIDRRTPVHLLTSRGCPAHCLFCSVVSFMRLSDGPQWRQHSIKRIVDEIEILAGQGARCFKIIDDSMLEPPRDLSWCTALADEINERNLKVRLRGMVRADAVNEAVVGELARAGFYAFYCGIENYAPSALKRMGKTASREQNLAALAAFKKFGMYVNAGHILFDHKTTMNELWQNMEGFRDHMWTISKGVFTEMFAAEGTPYTRLLKREGLLTMDDSGLGNHKYSVSDESARKVYFGLKKWHKSQTQLYDKTLDPVVSPKALEPWELEMFHSLYLVLRANDVEMLGQLLLLAETGQTEQAVLDFVEAEIESKRSWYAKFNDRVDRAYALTGLVYDADPNPFIC